MVRTPVVSPIAQLFGVQVVEYDGYSIPPQVCRGSKAGSSPSK